MVVYMGEVVLFAIGQIDLNTNENIRIRQGLFWQDLEKCRGRLRDNTPSRCPTLILKLGKQRF